MFSRKRLNMPARVQQRFSIRKLSVGAASVLLGVVFWGCGIANSSTVQAAGVETQDALKVNENSEGSHGADKNINPAKADEENSAGVNNTVTDQPKTETPVVAAANGLTNDGSSNESAAKDTQKESGFSVSDPDYPKDMPIDQNKDHYTYFWASKGKYTLILSTDRDGSGNVYATVYRDGKDAQTTVISPNKSEQIDYSEYEEFGDVKITVDQEQIGTIYNDGKSGVFEDYIRKAWFNQVPIDPQYLEKHYDVFDQITNDKEYKALSFMIPVKKKQVTTYVDEEGNQVDTPVEQEGLSGQKYTTAGGKVIDGYVAVAPENASGTMSPFGTIGEKYVKDWHDGGKAVFTQTGEDGTMQVHFTYQGKNYRDEVEKNFELKPGKNHTIPTKNGSYVIDSIYIPQTIDIQYVYKKLGNRVITSDDTGFVYNEDPVQYTNDPTDATQAYMDIPEIEGFTAFINGKEVKPGDKINPADYLGDKDLSKDVKIVYVAEQKATINYYDEDNGNQVLGSKHVSGKSGELITGTKTFDNYEIDTDTGTIKLDNYELDTEKPVTSSEFDNNVKEDQTLNVYLKHKTQKVGSRKVPVKQTIHYVYSDGSKAAEDSVQTLNFTADGVQDLVTGKTTWTPADSQTFNEVTSPVKTGYTADQTSVAGATVKFGDQDVTKTVTYTANDQTAEITYIDDTNQVVLKHDNAKGKTGGKIKFGTTDQDYPAYVISQYQKQGYILVSRDFDFTNPYFKNGEIKNGKSNNYYEVHFKHNTQPVTDPKTKTITRTINVTNPDGTVKTTKQTVDLNRTGTKDLVTNQIAWNNWSTGSWDAFTTPTIDGYTPSQAKVDKQDVNGDSQDTEVNITYKANYQKAYVTYIDDDTNKELRGASLLGLSGSDAGYTTAADIKAFEDQGYELVSDDTQGESVVFDHDDKNDQTYEVHLKHKANEGTGSGTGTGDSTNDNQGSTTELPDLPEQADPLPVLDENAGFGIKPLPIPTDGTSNYGNAEETAGKSSLSRSSSVAKLAASAHATNTTAAASRADELPQTGAANLGMAFGLIASLAGMLGLAGTHKRKQD
ncbi:MAG: YSIRK-type signal peptide-containing protein [Lactobacillus sp.]|nr:YSIRK-type signal peptide-containing protein [Lactobacillus sp.]